MQQHEEAQYTDLCKELHANIVLQLFISKSVFFFCKDIEKVVLTKDRINDI